MNQLPNDVKRLIYNIVAKNKIRSCSKKYHKTYVTNEKSNGFEEYCHRKAINFYAFNYRKFCSDIYNLKKYPYTCKGQLPDNYF